MVGFEAIYFLTKQPDSLVKVESGRWYYKDTKN